MNRFKVAFTTFAAVLLYVVITNHSVWFNGLLIGFAFAFALYMGVRIFNKPNRSEKQFIDKYLR